MPRTEHAMQKVQQNIRGGEDGLMQGLAHLGHVDELPQLLG